MKLHHHALSPYVRKVMVVAIETGLIGGIELLPTTPDSVARDVGGANPLGRIPALLLDDGSALYDSPVICEYLDSLPRINPCGPKLFPAAGPERWRALRQQALGDGILDAGIAARAESLRPADRRSDEAVERGRACLVNAIDALERAAAELDGPPSIGRIAVGVALGYLEFRYGGDFWRPGRPKIAAWYDRFAERESMRATAPQDAA